MAILVIFACAYYDKHFYFRFITYCARATFYIILILVFLKNMVLRKNIYYTLPL